MNIPIVNIFLFLTLSIFLVFAENSEELLKIENLITNDLEKIITFKPEIILKVKYGKKELIGNDILTPLEVKNKPIIEYNISNNDSSIYSLMLIDPDAPSRKNPIAAQWLHWLVNIPKNKINNGDDIVIYSGPTPPKGTGYHRYIFILCKQNSIISIDNEKKANLLKRKQFDFNIFIEMYNLKPLGVNFYQSRF